ncbi:hypothetical protein LY76DRAFT_37884 [Colletotrichum caudatum]|nr:hypothetical protein LY76DRAFT_37884 [Colletotrichum caudatum]
MSCRGTYASPVGVCTFLLLQGGVAQAVLSTYYRRRRRRRRRPLSSPGPLGLSNVCVNPVLDSYMGLSSPLSLMRDLILLLLLLLLGRGPNRAIHFTSLSVSCSGASQPGPVTIVSHSWV